MLECMQEEKADLQRGFSRPVSSDTDFSVLTESPPACSLDNNAGKHVKLYIGKVWRELQAGSQPLQIWRAAGICIGLREKHQLGVSCGLLSGG